MALPVDFPLNLPELSLRGQALLKLPFSTDDAPGEIISLDLGKNSLTLLEGIEGCHRLEYLVADNNEISNLSELARLGAVPRLRSLILRDNPVNDKEGYRSITIHLLPHLDSLDGLPITREERIAAEGYCRRNFSNLPSLLQNLNNITLFKNMLTNLKMGIENPEYQYDGSLSIQPVDYKALFKEVSQNLKEESALFHTRCTIDIIDDICVLVEDLVDNHGETNFLYDRAFLTLMQMQLAKIEELRNQVDSLVEDINNMSFKTAKNKQQEVLASHHSRSKSGERDRTQKSRNKSKEQSMESSESVVTKTKQFASRSRELKETHDSSQPRNPGLYPSGDIEQIDEETPQVESGPVSPLRPAIGYNLPPSKSSMVENQKRADDLTKACQNKDNELTNALSKTVTRREGLLRLNGRIDVLSQKDEELTQLERLRHKLEEEKQRLIAKLETIQDYEQESNRLTEENRTLKGDIEELQLSIKDLLIDETNLELALDLRNYHLRVKFFIGARDFVKNKKVEAIADQFRTYNLKAGLIRDWRESLITEKKYRVFCSRVKTSPPKDCPPEEIVQSLIDAFRMNRDSKWRKFYFDIIGQYSASRLEKEGLKELAHKYRETALKKKSLRTFRLVNSRYNVSSVVEAHTLSKVEPILENGKKVRIFTAWKTLFHKELKPQFRVFKTIQAVDQKRMKLELFKILQKNVSNTGKAVEKIKTNSQLFWAHHCLHTWIECWRTIHEKGRFAERRLNYKRKRNIFRSFVKGIRAEKIERSKIVEEERKSRAIVDKEKRIFDAENEREQLREEKWKDRTDTFKKIQSLKRLFSVLKEHWSETTELRGEGELLREVTSKKNRPEWHEWIRTQEERDRSIEENLPLFKVKIQSHRKRLVLQLLLHASVTHKCIEGKADNLKARVQLSTLRRSFRAFKKNLISSLTQQTKALDKRLFLDEDRLRQSDRTSLSTANESEYLESQTKLFEQTLKNRTARLDDARRASKALDEHKSNLSLQLELLEGHLKDRQKASAKRQEELEDVLEERRRKAKNLQSQLEGLLQEVKHLDKQIEGNLF